MFEVHEDFYARKAERIWKQPVSAKLLILDDFTFHSDDQREAEMLCALSDGRMEECSAIITSNCPCRGLVRHFSRSGYRRCHPGPFRFGLHKLITAGGKSGRKERFFTCTEEPNLEYNTVLIDY